MLDSFIPLNEEIKQAQGCLFPEGPFSDEGIFGFDALLDKSTKLDTGTRSYLSSLRRSLQQLVEYCLCEAVPTMLEVQAHET